MWIGFLKTYHIRQTFPEVSSHKFLNKRAAYKWFSNTQTLIAGKIAKIIKVLYEVPDDLVLPDDVILSLPLPVHKEHLYETFFSIHAVNKKYVVLEPPSSYKKSK
jgi:hypothetical protein